MAAVDLIPIIAPELVANPNLSGAILIAASQVAANHCYKDLVTAYMAAHVLTLASRGGTGGTVTSETEGSLSRTFSTSATVGMLGATSYGQEVSRLNRLCFGMSATTGWIS